MPFGSFATRRFNTVRVEFLRDAFDGWYNLISSSFSTGAGVAAAVVCLSRRAISCLDEGIFSAAVSLQFFIVTACFGAKKKAPQWVLYILIIFNVFMTSRYFLLLFINAVKSMCNRC